jgi:DNA polymerase-1
MIVGDHAGVQDYLAKLPFHGPEGRLLEEALGSSVSSLSIAYSSAVRGWPVIEETLPVKYQNTSIFGASAFDLERARTASLSSHPSFAVILKECFPFLEQDIARTNPKKIVALGTTVVNALFPYEKGSSLSSLQMKNLTYKGIPVITLSAPTSVLRNPSSKDGWIKQFRESVLGVKEHVTKNQGNTVLLTNYQQTSEYLDYLINYSGDVAVDTETTNLNKRYGNKLLTVQFATKGDEGVVIPFYHSETPFSPVELEELKVKFRTLLAGSVKIHNWVCHNAKFENSIFRQTFDTPIRSAPIFDTQIGAFLLDENRGTRYGEFKYSPYSLKQLSLDYNKFDGYDKGALKAREEGSMADLSLAELAAYGAMDAYQTLLLKQNQIVEAKRQKYAKQLIDLMSYLYNPIIELFSEIEWNGSPVNADYLKFLYRKEESPIRKAIKTIEEGIKKDPKVKNANQKLLHRQAFGNTNENKTSVKPLFQDPWIFSFAKKNHPQTLFFEVLGLPVGRRADGGTFSVDDEWQQKHKSHPLVAQFSDWVLYRKMEDSFVSKMYERIDPTGPHLDTKVDAKLRPDFFIASVVTGRIACKNPNLQACPRAENEAKKAVKDIFQAMPGYVMVQFDFKANEMRWVGIVAQDKAMGDNFHSGYQANLDFRANPTEDNKKKAEIYGDVHRQNASKAFGIHIEKVTKDQRQKAKGCSFGVLYDSSVKSVAELYGMELEQCQEMFDTFYRTHPNILAWKNTMKRSAQERGYVETPHGRRRRFPIFDLFRDKYGRFNRDLLPRDFRSSVEDALRQSSNAPIQGIASDAAMIGAYLFLQEIRKNNKPWFIQNAVHDSMVFQCPLEDLEEAMLTAEKSLTTQAMEYMQLAWNINFNLPIEVDGEAGLKWGEMEKWDGTLQNLTELKTKLTTEAYLNK